MLAMGQWYPGKRRHCDRRCNPRHHLILNSRRAQRFGLFTAAPENKWIAALEPHHASSAPRLLNQYSVDFRLRYVAAAAALLARKNQFRVFAREPQGRVSHQI